MAKIFCVFLLLVGVSIASGSISIECLSCLCDAIIGCRTGLGCEGNTCGSFRIAMLYWIDAGNHTLEGVSPDHPDAYGSCTMDYDCSQRTIRGYMRRYNRDCNNDGVINCFDHMSLHGYGPNLCSQGLRPGYSRAYEQCSLYGLDQDTC